MREPGSPSAQTSRNRETKSGGRHGLADFLCGNGSVVVRVKERLNTLRP